MGVHGFVGLVGGDHLSRLKRFSFLVGAKGLWRPLNLTLCHSVGNFSPICLLLSENLGPVKSHRPSYDMQFFHTILLFPHREEMIS